MIKSFDIIIAALGLALVHIGTVGNAVILLVAYLNADYSGGFLERIYHMGLIPGFVVFCMLSLAGLLTLIFSPNEKSEKQTT